MTDLRARRSTGSVVLALLAPTLLLLGACGSDSSTDDTGSTAAEPSGSASASASADGDAPFVPGDPQNEVRPASDDEVRDWPACADVWAPDGDIPATYEGCVDDGEAVVADRIPCSFGGSVTTYDDRYYGVIGAVVNDAGTSLADSRQYARAYRQCTA